MLNSLLLASILAINSAHAAFRSEEALKTIVVDGTITATLEKGFHFNSQAPNSIRIDTQRVKPSHLEPQKAEFANLPKNWSSIRATFYVCDDDVTFCEAINRDLSNPNTANSVASEKKDAPQTIAMPSEETKINAHGFIENDFGKALAQAKKEKKLLLVDFSARWCPACVRMESDIFPTDQFQKISKDFVKLKLDVDRLENSIFSNKFKIAGIPTILILNSDQQEIDRVVDFQSISSLSLFLTSVKADPISLERLIARAKKKEPKNLLRAGKRLAAAGRYKESLEYLSLVKPPPVELLDVKVQAAEGSKDYAKVLREAIEAEPETIRSLLWRKELLANEKNKEEKADIKKDGLSIAEDFLKDKEAITDGAKGFNFGEYQGFESFYIAVVRAELIEASGASAAEVTEGWRRAAKTARELKIPPSQIGVSMRRLMVLGQAGLWDEADKVSEAMVKADPQNPELQRRRLRVLIERKDFDKAIELGQQVLQNSYGKNEYMVAESLAKAYIQAKRYPEGLALIDSFLNRPDVEWESIKSLRAKLEELKAKVPKG